MARFFFIVLAFFAFAAPATAASKTSPTLDTTASPPATKVFGSNYIAIAPTPLDDDWQRATAGKLKRKTIKWARSLAKLPVSERITIINNQVNRQIRYVADKNDLWKPAAITLEDGFGDCEDYAVLKLALLEAAGIPAKDMMMTIGRHIVLKADHAMLIVRNGNKTVVLDNNTGEMLNGALPGLYMPMLTYTADGQRWSHSDVPGHTVTLDKAPVALTMDMTKE